MLSEDEKKAIEMICYIKENNTLIGFKVEDREELANTVLNLITKLQKENEEKDNKVRKIINRLDNDCKRIRESKINGNRYDDYRKCRLKAYRTKTREIKEYIEQEYFEKLAKEKENK